MRIKPADLPFVCRTGVAYARYKLSDPAAAVRSLMTAPEGRAELSPVERRFALRADMGLRRLGVRCLARSVVVARLLRREGVGAAISISVDADNPNCAHAEVAVGGHPLRPHPEGNVLLS